MDIEIENKLIDNIPNNIIYTTPSWLNFLKETQKKIEPVILKIYENEVLIGYFTGCIIRKYGMKFLGSPLRGWNTPYMGFNVSDYSKKYAILKHLHRYALKELRCLYVEVCDRDFIEEELKNNKFQYIESEGFELDLSLPHEEIYKNFTKGTKANIKKFERIGCTIQEDYSEEFVREYWEQLVDVFKRQGLNPTYSINRVRSLITNLKFSNNILCLKALTPEKKHIASLIQIGSSNLTITFGVPSYTNFQKEYRPNEALMWYAIKWWKDKGVELYDFGGGGEYKKKYGGSRIKYFTVCHSKIPLALVTRKLLIKIYWLMKKNKINKSDGELDHN